MSSPVVAIDLGTTNSLIGRLNGAEPQLFTDARGSVMLPSVVGATDDGTIVVGRAARNQLLLRPQGTVARCKRLMGSKHKLQLGDRSVSPTEVAAFILSELLNRAEMALGERPKRAVITVPAFFNDAQRQATRDAGEIAGLTVERLVNEPTAAALNYETGQESKVLIYDFGGGTLDVSVLDRDEGFLEVRASHGNTELGGADIDAALVEHLLQRLGQDRSVVEQDLRAMTRLTEAAERAKIALSDRDSVQLVEPFLAAEGKHTVNLELELTRQELNSLLDPLIEQSLSCIDQALADAKLDAHALDRVVLVGGSSRIPHVQQRVAEHLQMPAQVDPQADVAVALGATRLAARAEGLDVDDVLVDITPHTLAVGVFDDDPSLVASAVIDRNTVVPCSREKTYYTHAENQTAITIPIVQGEHYRSDDNTQLGALMAEDLPPGPINSPVAVKFELDLSGVLRVSAIHVPSGRRASIRIANGPSRLSAQARRAARAKLDAGKQAEPAARESADLAELSLARALLERAARVLETRADDASPEALARVKEAKEELALGIEESRPNLPDLADALSDTLLDLT